MRRSPLMVLSVVFASVALVGVSYFVAMRLCAARLSSQADDLTWLRREFRLSDADLQRVRQLHEGYLPKCREMCERIAAKKLELEAALAISASPSATAEQCLAELGALRARCQTEMLRHFYEVSQAMPPEQGRRYLSEMQRLTLGFHEQTERAMPGKPPSAHEQR